jgi:preprotein translocase subunit SecE
MTCSTTLSTTTLQRRASAPSSKERVSRTDKGEGIGFFGRIGRFFREIIAELRKVIWPTRNELLTYTAVVIVFVTVMVTIVGLLDLAYAQGVLVVFGNPK